MNTGYHLDEILKHERHLAYCPTQAALNYHTQQIERHKNRRERLIGILRIQRRLPISTYWPLHILYTYYYTYNIARRNRFYGLYKIIRRYEQN